MERLLLTYYSLPFLATEVSSINETLYSTNRIRLTEEYNENVKLTKKHTYAKCIIHAYYIAFNYLDDFINFIT